jgi:hypothetical protein
MSPLAPVPYPTSWLAAGRRLLAPSGREPAAGQFADVHTTNAVPSWLRLTRSYVLQRMRMLAVTWANDG